MIKSFPWTCSPIGDGGNYSVEIVEATTRILGNLSPTDSGVVYWTDSTPFPGFTHGSDGLLAPTYLGANLVEIDTGIGLVQGWVFIQDLSATTDVSGGNANATDIIGLRRDVAAQTVRIFHGRGGIGTTYPLVQTSAIWEIPLAEVLLDGSGNYSSFTDVRKAVSTPSKVLLEEIDVGGLDSWSFDDIPPLYGGLEVEFIGAIDGSITHGPYWMDMQVTNLSTSVHVSMSVHKTPSISWFTINQDEIANTQSSPAFATTRIKLWVDDYTNTNFIVQFRTVEVSSKSSGSPLLNTPLVGQYGHVQNSSAVQGLTFEIWDDTGSAFVSHGETMTANSKIRLYGTV